MEFRAFRWFPVANMAETTGIKVYEYYEPGKNAIKIICLIINNARLADVYSLILLLIQLLTSAYR